MIKQDILVESLFGGEVQMQDNTVEYKYVEKININLINSIEKQFNVLLPEDYKVALPLFNRGKPLKDRIDITNRPESVVDYFVNLSLVIDIAESISQKGFISIASDPFGNYFGFLKVDDEIINAIYFWDHETNTLVKAANSFSEFINNLY